MSAASTPTPNGSSHEDGTPRRDSSRRFFSTYQPPSSPHIASSAEAHKSLSLSASSLSGGGGANGTRKSPSSSPGVLNGRSRPSFLTKVESKDSASPVTVSSNSGDSEDSRSSNAKTTTTFDVNASQEQRINRMLEASSLDLARLRKACWNGVPPKLRAKIWKLLVGYLPTSRERRTPTLQKRRAEYRGFVDMYYDVAATQRTEAEQKMMNQVLADVPRTNPDVPLFQDKRLQQSLTRLLYVWSIRHPATGYVQGINDLASPFVYLFFIEEFEKTSSLDSLDEDTWYALEADSFWCLSKLLEGIQDHYTFAQPGLQRMVFKLKELIHRHNESLHAHLEENNLMFIHFAFRWMNCLLLREMPLRLILRLWDTYLSSDDPPGLTGFHIYVCAALMEKYASKLLQLDFQELVLFLQHLPTHKWTERDIETLVSNAYILQSLYHNAQSHLK